MVRHLLHLKEKQKLTSFNENTNVFTHPLQDILKSSMDDGLKCATELPYFEGDFWPNVLEESIKELDQEEEERQKAAEKAAAAQSTSEEVGVRTILTYHLTLHNYYFAVTKAPRKCLYRGFSCDVISSRILQVIALSTAMLASSLHGVV